MDGNIIGQLKKLIEAASRGNKQAEGLLIDSFLSLTKRVEEAEKKAHENSVELIVDALINKK